MQKNFFFRSKRLVKKILSSSNRGTEDSKYRIYEEEKDTEELASYPGTVSRFLGSKRFPSKAIKDTPLKKN
jgi:hypothetical protein